MSTIVTDISPAFNNGIFHAIAAHIISHQEINKQQQTIDYLLQASSNHISDLFSNEQEFDAFFQLVQTYKESKFEGDPQQGEAYERILLLGQLLRLHLAQLLREQPPALKRLEDMFVRMVAAFVAEKAETQCLDKDIIRRMMKTEIGLLAKAGEYFLTESRHEHDRLDESLIRAYWQRQGYKNYIDSLIKDDALISYFDIVPLVDDLQIPLAVHLYDHMADSNVGQPLLAVDDTAASEAYPTLTLLLDKGQLYHAILPDIDFNHRLIADVAFYKSERDQIATWSIYNVAVKQGIAMNRKALFLSGRLAPHERSTSGVQLMVHRVINLLTEHGQKPANLQKGVLPMLNMEHLKIRPTQGGRYLAMEELADVSQLLTDLMALLSKPLPERRIGNKPTNHYLANFCYLYKRSAVYQTVPFGVYPRAHRGHFLNERAQLLRQKLLALEPHEQYQPMIEEMEQQLQDDEVLLYDSLVKGFALAHVFLTAEPRVKRLVAKNIWAIANDMDRAADSGHNELHNRSDRSLAKALRQLLYRCGYGEGLTVLLGDLEQAFLQGQLSQEQKSSIMTKCFPVNRDLHIVDELLAKEAAAQVQLHQRQQYQTSIQKLSQLITQLPSYSDQPHLGAIIRELDRTQLPLETNIEIRATLYVLLASVSYTARLNAVNHLQALATSLNQYPNQAYKQLGAVLSAYLIITGSLLLALTSSIGLPVALVAIGALAAALTYTMKNQSPLTFFINQHIQQEVSLHEDGLAILADITNEPKSSWQKLRQPNVYQRTFNSRQQLDAFLEGSGLLERLAAHSTIQHQLSYHPETKSHVLLLTGADNEQLQALYAAIANPLQNTAAIPQSACF